MDENHHRCFVQYFYLSPHACRTIYIANTLNYDLYHKCKVITSCPGLALFHWFLFIWRVCVSWRHLCFYKTFSPLVQGFFRSAEDVGERSSCLYTLVQRLKSGLTTEFNSWLAEHVYGQDLDAVVPSLIATAQSLAPNGKDGSARFWDNWALCLDRGGRGDALSIFIYNLWAPIISTRYIKMERIK